MCLCETTKLAKKARNERRKVISWFQAFAFKFSLYGYAVGRVSAVITGGGSGSGEVGLCKLRIQLTHSLKPPGFNP